MCLNFEMMLRALILRFRTTGFRERKRSSEARNDFSTRKFGVLDPSSRWRSPWATSALPLSGSVVPCTVHRWRPPSSLKALTHTTVCASVEYLVVEGERSRPFEPRPLPLRPLQNSFISARTQGLLRCRGGLHTIISGAIHLAS